MNKEEFLLDMLDYYIVDPASRRCRNENNCYYSSNEKPTSEGCAIGRHLDADLALQLDMDGVGSIQDVLDMRKEYLPDWMVVLGRDFLSFCQNLHDTSINWDETGLSLNGKEYLVDRITKFNLDKSKFEKYL